MLNGMRTPEGTGFNQSLHPNDLYFHEGAAYLRLDFQVILLIHC
jgi:hypothetical protein